MILSYLALGSNLRTPERQLRFAVQRLRKLPGIQIIKVAPFYKNPALGRKAQPTFCNTVVAINTSLRPEQLLKKCQTIERKHGRIRKIKWGARTLDIDILLYGSLEVSHPKLTIPHPQMWNRDFVIQPLLEIASHITLPDGKQIQQYKR